ncbi:uncharacterized protein LOC8040054 isoform X3 [Ixodes scapularis]|uniref:uncharacterized protein LOC8040054 isoform X3 n=1 Tax=Ixodes scapularis TaxID=6945 RepID=UPI001A9F3653|nr:uncharacterized protein LOC8040054 isoform X3 [Ixodes scapularis]
MAMRWVFGHETRTSSWLPPVDSWSSSCTGLPYGWEAAVDKNGRSYFINHVSKTTTYEDPRKDYEEEPPPSPREVELLRDPQLGFGFVAGSEKPVIVRFVTEGGPSEHKLQPGDQILGINGEDVKCAPREHVIELVKSCKQSVKLVVCQPHVNNTTRKSALLTAAKKAKLKSNPSRVRFAEGVVINGSPLYCPSTFESCVPFLPNVMKVFLENGQTKSFKYDSSTTVQDVLNSLQEKLSVKSMEHFGLVVEHIKSVRRNKLTLLDPKDSLAKIAARPGAHHLRCLFRVAFVPLDAYDLLQKDPVAFEYLYVQCCNDMVQERFAPELKYDVALKLAALHIHLHALTSGMQGKITIKAVERESGLKRFVPASLLETMKRKELRKLLSHFLKQNQSLCAPGQKQLTPLQAKLHYLKIVGELPSYGAKCFSTCMKDSNMETGILISPKFGISQINSARGAVPIQPVTLAQIAEVSSVTITKDDDLSYAVEISIKDPDKESLKFGLEDRETAELVFILKGYHKLLASRDLPIHWETDDPWKVETSPCFHGSHIVCPTPWSYAPSADDQDGPIVKRVDLAVPPPAYVPCELPDRGMSRSSSREQCSLTSLTNSVDHNMNETSLLQPLSPSRVPRSSALGSLKMETSFEPRSPNGHGFPSDSASSTADESEERLVKFDIMDDDDDDDDEEPILLEVKNEEVLRRVSEMRRMVADAEHYLSDGRPRPSAADMHSESTSSDEREMDCSLEPRGTIKAADSLLLLTQLDDVSEAVNQVAVPDEVSPSESDTDSFGTPNRSPLHRTSRLTGAADPEAPPARTRSGSSFGLHSPDMLPGIGSSDRDLLELLKQLQSNPEIQLPFAEGTLYLDPDIIDLTMIPPPMTPDVELCDASPGTLDLPPTPFSDKGVPRSGTGATELDGGHSMVPPPCSIADSARVVAELDDLCDALTEMRASGDELGCHALFQQLGCEDLETFIASVTIPPPPLPGSGPSDDGDSGVTDDDIAAYIIPPPPPSCEESTQAQNQVLARFERASEDMRRMMMREDGQADGRADDAKVAAVGPPPLEALKVFDVLAGYGDLLVTDSSNSSSPNPAVRETDRSSHTYENLDLPPSRNRGGPLLNGGGARDYEEVAFGGEGKPRVPPRLRKTGSAETCVKRDRTGSCDGPEASDSAAAQRQVARSHSWTNLHGLSLARKNSMGKPPLPPGSPSLQSRTGHSTASSADHGRSLTRPGSASPRTASPLSPRKTTSPVRAATIGRAGGRSFNGPPTSFGNSNAGDVYTEAGGGDETVPSLFDGVNGCLCLPFATNNPTTPEMPCLVCNRGEALGSALGNENAPDAPFLRAQEQVYTMVLRIDDVARDATALQRSATDTSVGDKFSSARDELVTESRQFVTASKLFVRSATEGAPNVLEHLVTCVALLDRMFAACEMLVLSGGSAWSGLVEQVKAVALAYTRAAGAARKSAQSGANGGAVGSLMHQATDLASALTALMRTLRSFDNS